MSSDSWTETTLGAVAKVRSGYSFKSKDWVEAGVPVVKIANVHDGAIDLSGCAFVTDEIAEQASGFYLDPGDIVITMTGRIGEVARVPPTPRMILNQRVGRFSVGDGVDADFVFHSLRDPSLRKRMEVHAYGVAQPNISPSLIEAMPIWLPGLPTQRKIAAILSAYDDLIANNLRRIELLEQMARTIYREWFVEFRYPGSEGVPLVESELGPIPEGWEVTTLGGLADFKGGSTATKASYVDDGYVAYSAAGPDGLLPDFEVDAKGVVLSAVGARCGRTWLAMGRWSSIANTMRYMPKPAKATAEWLFHATVNPDAWPKRGSAQPFVSINDARNRPVVAPPYEIVEHFTDLVSPMHEFQGVLTEANSSLRSTRDLLLPKLVSGEVDVSALDIDLGVPA